MKELLESLVKQTFQNNFEIIIVEDGSKISSKDIVNYFSDTLNINYFFKENSGPGIARNFGMQKASGDYYIILDSDCILPINYLVEVDLALNNNFTDAFGGADAAHESFSTIQRAINYAMTSILTTGGIRGNKNVKSKFQPRSFNMGISKVAFKKTTGFSKQRFGEDIDLTFRLWEYGFHSQFIERAYVYHKRRTDWRAFLMQTFNFGAARPILSKVHVGSAKITYWFPSLFLLGGIFAVLFFVLGRYEPLLLYALYFMFIFSHSLLLNKNMTVAFMSIFATLIQFTGYGCGFLRSFFRLNVLQKHIKHAFPRMFA